jgi:hypothetical protein
MIPRLLMRMSRSAALARSNADAVLAPPQLIVPLHGGRVNSDHAPGLLAGQNSVAERGLGTSRTALLRQISIQGRSRTMDRGTPFAHQAARGAR